MSPGETTTRQLLISNTGAGTMVWIVSPDQPWITVYPNKGINEGNVTISINTADLSSGRSYNGTISITSTGVSEVGKLNLNIISNIAYIYSTDSSSANEYKSFLESAGFSTDLILSSDIAISDFSKYDVIIIGNDTPYAKGGSLLSSSDISKINSSEKPIIGLGEGGYGFFGSLGLMTGTPYGWHGNSNSIMIDPNNSVFNNVFNKPGQFTILEDNVLKLYNSTRNVGIYLATVPPNVTILGMENGTDGEHYSFTLENSRYILWGFTASPTAMTPTGKDLFINTILFLMIPAPIDSISNFQVSGTSNKEILINVDYSYNTDHGNNVFLGAYALRGGQKLAEFGYGPGKVNHGTGSANVRLVFLNNNPPANVTTDQVEVDLYVGGSNAFYSKKFDYTKTWPLDPVIHSTGQLTIDQTWTADIDEGKVGAGLDSDIWFEAVTANERYIVPQNGATMAKVGTSAVGPEGCSSASLSNSRININELPKGTYVCVRTNLGRYSQFRVDAPVGPSPGVFIITYTTW